MGSWLKRNAWLVAIACAYLYVFPYFPKTNNANELPRVYLVKAIADDHTFMIDSGVARWGKTADVATIGPHSYSNKAPGSSMLVAPVYAVVALFGEPGLGATVWLCRVVAGVIPTLLFLLLLSRFLERYADEEVRRVVLIAYALGSMAMTFSVLFIAHQLSAVVVGSCWILALDYAERRRGLGALIGAGLLAGCAPLVDYQAAFAIPVIAVHAIVKLRGRSPKEYAQILGIAIAAAAVPIAILLAYHHAAFGSALCTGYDPACVKTPWAGLQNQGFLGLSGFRPTAFVGSTLSLDNGLFALSPWLLLAVPGLVLLWRRERATAITCGVLALLYVGFVSSLAMWRAGWSVGPRYITVMLPFLLPPIATTLQAWRGRWWLFGIAAGTILVGIAIYTISSATFIPWPDEMGYRNTVEHVANPFYEISLRLLADGRAAPNALSALLGDRGLIGVLPYLGLVFGLAAVSLRRVAGWRPVALGVVIALGILLIYSQLAATPHADELFARVVRFMA